jgi:hypothetical protein
MRDRRSHSLRSFNASCIGFMTAGLLLAAPPAEAQTGLLPIFRIDPSDIALTRAARPGTPFDKVGRRFAILGHENGAIEAWAYPLKLFRNFELSFYIGSSTDPIRSADIVRWISVSPEVTTLTYVFQSFTIRAHYIAAIEEPGALLLLEVDGTEPMTIVCSFLPVLQPMWPAGIGGQYAYWDEKAHAYLISEPTRKNHGYVGSPAASGMSYTPAHMLSDVPNQFRISLPSPDSVRGKFIPIVMAGGKGPRDSVRAVYDRLLASPERYYREAREHYRLLRNSSCRIVTPEPQLNLAYEWAKVAYDNLFVSNPDLGYGMVAGLAPSGTSGRPGFGWFFGGDTFINAFSLNSTGAFGAVRDAIRFTQKWQREDGKMAHELSQAAGYLNWFTDYPYGYIHGDTSPFYIAATEDYYRWTADTAFVRKSWPSLVRAYEWSRSTDLDGDGLMDNRKAGLGASEYGALTEVQSDIYTAAVWIRAARAMGTLAAAVGDTTMFAGASGIAARATAAFHGKFWDAERGQYAYAFDRNGRHVDVLSPWSSVGLMWEFGQPEASRKTIERLNSADLTTDWGTRSISVKHRLFEPLNYNYGAVWPFLTSWVAAAQYRHHYGLQGYASLMASVRHTFDNALGSVTEVFSGSHNTWPQEAVAHQGFCSAGVVLPFVRGMLGIEPDAPHRTVTFAPQLPANWEEVAVTDLRVGPAICSFLYTRSPRRITLRGISSDSLTLVFAPVLSPSAKIGHVRVGGKPCEADVRRHSLSVQPAITTAIRDSFAVEIDYESAIELLPPVVETRTGDPNAGVKIVSSVWKDGRLTLTLEGLAGTSSRIPLLLQNPGGPVTGARLDGTVLIVDFPAGRDFVRSVVTVEAR